MSKQSLHIISDMTGWNSDFKHAASKVLYVHPQLGKIAYAVLPGTKVLLLVSSSGDI